MLSTMGSYGRLFCFLFLVSAGGGCLFAGKPVPWQMGLQAPSTPVMEQIVSFHSLITLIMGVIGLFVLGMLGYVVWRFRASKHPRPQKFSDNLLLEVVWTLIPFGILLTLMIPSLKLLYFMDKMVDADLTVKVTGHQWYWTYEYPDYGFSFDSLMLTDQERKPGQPRLLAVDHPLIVPSHTNVRVILTSADVIHSWTVPAFGIKKDTVPGRLTETWFQVNQEGIFYGQCSELCGVNHGFMPIMVEVIPRDRFYQWIETQKAEKVGEK